MPAEQRQIKNVAPVHSSPGAAGLVQIEAWDVRSEAGHGWGRRATAILILVCGAVLPAWFAGLQTPASQTRNIHIEAYRYGFSPSRVFVNRGDRLRLTFSTRDTGQSFFLQEL